MIPIIALIIYVFGIMIHIMGIICLCCQRNVKFNGNPQRIIFINLSVVQISLAIVQIYFFAQSSIVLSPLLHGIVSLYILSFTTFLLDPVLNRLIGITYKNDISEMQIKCVVMLIWTISIALTGGYAFNAYITKYIATALEIIFLLGVSTWVLWQWKKGVDNEMELTKDVGKKFNINLECIFYISCILYLLVLILHYTLEGSILTHICFIFISFHIAIHPIIYIPLNEDLRNMWANIFYCIFTKN